MAVTTTPPPGKVSPALRTLIEMFARAAYERHLREQPKRKIPPEKVNVAKAKLAHLRKSRLGSETRKE